MKIDLPQSPLTSHLIVAQRLLKPLQQQVSSLLLLRSSQSTATRRRLSHLAFGEARSSNRAAWASKDSVEDNPNKLVADQCSDYHNEVGVIRNHECKDEYPVDKPVNNQIRHRRQQVSQLIAEILLESLLSRRSAQSPVLSPMLNSLGVADKATNAS